MVQPASVDLKLGTSFRVFHNHRLPAIDLAEPPHRGDRARADRRRRQSFVIHPGEFVLGTTVEWVELPDDIVARIEGKSSLGRLGLIVHATAGFVDPGFSGTLTLEITNLTRVPIVLWPGKPIAQLSFMALDQAGRAALRSSRSRKPLPRPGGGHGVPLRGRPPSLGTKPETPEFLFKFVARISDTGGRGWERWTATGNNPLHEARDAPERQDDRGRLLRRRRARPRSIQTPAHPPAEPHRTSTSASSATPSSSTPSSGRRPARRTGACCSTARTATCSARVSSPRRTSSCSTRSSTAAPTRWPATTSA